MTDRQELARQALAAAEAAVRAAGHQAATHDSAATGTPDTSVRLTPPEVRPGATRGSRRSGPAGSGRPSRSDTGPDADPLDTARGIALRQLAMGPRSRAQLAAKLAARGCDPAVSDTVLERLTDVGLIDDQAFAQMLVASKQASRGLAKRGLAHELRDKGIDEDIVSTALSGIHRDDELELARRLATKKMASMHGLGVDVQTRRIAAMLARKGYPPSVVYPVVRDVVDDAPEHRRD